MRTHGNTKLLQGSLIPMNHHKMSLVVKQEEAGVEVGSVLPITSYYPSSGGCSEKLDVFVGCVDATTAKGVHGLDYEGEDIRVQVMSRGAAYQLVKDGMFENGATIIALQWLQLNYQELQSEWID